MACYPDGSGVCLYTEVDRVAWLMAQGVRPGGGADRFRRGRLGEGPGLDRLPALALRARPRSPGNGFEYNSLYDKFYLYPREQRIVPQIQGPYYRNFYGGKRTSASATRTAGTSWNKKKFYQGYHFVLDVF